MQTHAKEMPETVTHLLRQQLLALLDSDAVTLKVSLSAGINVLYYAQDKRWISITY